MIVNIENTYTDVVVSYINKSGQIEIKEYNVFQYTDNFGFFDHEITTEDDPDKLDNLKHWDGSPIKRVKSNRFDFEELRMFLNDYVPKKDQEQIKDFTYPNCYAIDIEIKSDDPNDEAFPDPEIAAKEITTIQITAPGSYNTIALTTEKSRSNEVDDQKIQDFILEHFSDLVKNGLFPSEFKYKTIYLDNEYELIDFLFSAIKDKIHTTIWWNSKDFDLPYLYNRAKKLEKIYSTNPIEKNKITRISQRDLYPKHRLTFDYMDIVKKYCKDINPILSYSLDWISTELFGIGKVPYNGTFTELYTGPFWRFLAYGAVDTILVQLIHQNRNYIAPALSLGYYTVTPVPDTQAKTPMIHGVIYDSLIKDGLINSLPYEKAKKKEYEGAYVKQPTQKFVEYVIGIDFKSLYPMITASLNFSFENYLGKIDNKKDAEKLIKKGLIVSVLGHVFRNDKPYTYKKILLQLYKSRKFYKSLMLDIHNRIIPKIEEHLKIK